ncbi:MAG: hypothetical protein NTZ67_08745 [Gammaproteobacteria bacterium]|nr:hypothetical protein [Gammaproteobacteria bacterium]
MKYFYISSKGASASVWLATQLNKYPEIFSLHGTRSAPPMSSGLGIDQTPHTFFTELTKYSALLKPKANVVGSIHGFYGLDALNEVKKRNGVFVGLLRNPVNRIHSLFSLNIKNNYYETFNSESADESNIYNIIKDFHLDNYSFSSKENTEVFKKTKHLIKKILYPIIKNKRYRAPISISSTEIDGQFITLSGIATHFFHQCYTIISDDFELMSNLPKSHLFKMEDLISSKDSFNLLIDTISQNTLMKKDDPTTISQSYNNKINTHSASQMTDEEIYMHWPPSFKLIYNSVLHYFKDNNILNLYKEKLDYDVIYKPKHLKGKIKESKIILSE